MPDKPNLHLIQGGLKQIEEELILDIFDNHLTEVEFDEKLELLKNKQKQPILKLVSEKN